MLEFELKKDIQFNTMVKEINAKKTVVTIRVHGAVDSKQVDFNNIIWMDPKGRTHNFVAERIVECMAQHIVKVENSTIEELIKGRYLENIVGVTERQ